MLLVMMLTSVTAWAQDPVLVTEVPVVDGGATTNWGNTENYTSLVDGNTETKYGISNANPWVEFHYTADFVPKAYILWTANDSEGTRNPINWTIKAKLNQNDEWTTIATVDNSSGDQLPMTNDTQTEFSLADNTNAYRYFRFEATKHSSNGFQLAELQFKSEPGNPNNLLYATITGIDSRYLYTGSAINITPVVKDADGTVLTLGTHFSATLGSTNVTAFPFTVTDKGNYTLTITGMGSYRGSQTVTFSVSDCPEGLSIDNDITEGTIGHYHVNMPQTGTTTVTLPNGFTSAFKVYDNGGKSGNYSKGCNGYLTLTAPEGYKFKITGTVVTDEHDTYLTMYDGIYDGVGEEPDYLGDKKRWSKTEPGEDVGTITAKSQSVTLYFCTHPNYRERSGLDLTVTLVDVVTPHAVTINQASNGTVSADNSSVPALSTVTLTANPNTGYMLSAINVKDADQNVVDVNWSLYDNTATFMMPDKAVTVTSTFANIPDALSVNMPTTGSKTVTIPSATTTMNVYDDGGPSNDYSTGCNGYLTLIAPIGYRVQLKGTAQSESDYYGEIIDYLTIYDGNYDGAGDTPQKFNNKDKWGGTATEDIGTLTSTGRYVTLYFYSNLGTSCSGLNLTANLVEVIEHDVIIDQTAGGNIIASPAKAVNNQIVTLTATTENDYVLSGISVKDASNNDVAVTWNHYSNTASFSMPSTAATVTPTYLQLTEDFSVNMPAGGQTNIDLPGNVKTIKVYDDGGKDGNHTSGCDGMLLLTAPENYIMEVSGTVTTKSDGTTYLAIRDGATTGSNLFQGAEALHSNTDNVEQNIGPYTTTGRNMLFRFCSTSSDTYPGLNLTVKLINTVADYNVNVSNTEGGSVTPDPTSGKLGDVINLTATPSTGYMLNGISVEDADQNAVTVTGGEWYSNNTASFSMPGSDVTVTPSFTNDWTANSLSAIIPKTGDKTITIPSGVQSFKVYDHGGTAGAYDAYCNGTLTLTAPDGYVLQLTGTIMTGSNSDDWLSAYNGANTSATPLLNQKTSDVVGMVLQTTDIGVIASSDNNMTLQFHSGPSISSFSTGLDLTVTLVSKTEEFAINIPTVSNGSVSVVGDATTANVNDLVTLNASPDEGYLLGILRVVDANSNVIPTEWNVFENTATFTMPGSAVTVTPEFVSTNPLSINIPAVGTVRATIPAGITSLKVYDDGGASGSYSNGCNGQLILTAPAGYVLQIAGTMTTENDDILDVCNGTDNTGSSIFHMSSSTNGTQTVVGPKVSTGNSVLIRFESDSNPNNYAGLDLTVTLVPITYTISFNKNNDSATGTMDAQTHTYDAELTLTANSFEYTGYAFAGWNTVATPTTETPGTAYTDGQNVQNLTTENGVTITLYAQWTRITYAVTVTAGGNMTKTNTSGEASQTVNAGDAMTAMVYTANEGYYFPTDYSVAEVNGISVTLDSYTQITVSGTPTAAAEITLTAPTEKTKPVAPTTPAATDCTTADNNDGKLTGVTTAMEYKKSGDDSWTDGTGSDITGLIPGTYYVRIKATDTTLASDNQELTIATYVSYTDGTITQDESGYTVSLTENGEGTNPLPVSGTVKDLDYSRSLTPPTSDKHDYMIGSDPANLFTVCLPFEPKTGDGVKYYTLNSVSDKTLHFTEVTTTPAAYTPYMVAVTGSGITESCTDATFDTSHDIISTTVQTDAGNYTFTGTLTGLSNADALTAASAAGSDCIYILQHNAKWGRVVSGNASVKIPPFRAFITGPDVTTPSGARQMNSSFGDDDATGIDSIKTTDADGTERWYDLNGRRIAKPNRKGLYIRNGKVTTTTD